MSYYIVQCIHDLPEYYVVVTLSDIVESDHIVRSAGTENIRAPRCERDLAVIYYTGSVRFGGCRMSSNC